MILMHIDPEPLGTERFERLMQLESPKVQPPPPPKPR